MPSNQVRISFVMQGQVLATITPTQTNTNANNSNTVNTNLVAPGNATVEVINGVVGQQVSPNGTAISGSGSNGSGSGSSGSGSGSSNQAFMVLVDTSQMNIVAATIDR